MFTKRCVRKIVYGKNYKLKLYLRIKNKKEIYYRYKCYICIVDTLYGIMCLHYS